MDVQVFPEIRHVLSDVQHLCTTSGTLTPSTAVNRAQHDVVLRSDGGGESSPDDDPLQFGSMGDECLAAQTEAARLVEKRQSRRVEISDMDDQRDLSDARRSMAARAFGEALFNVRVEDERVARRQRAEATRRPMATSRHARRLWNGGRLPQG